MEEFWHHVSSLTTCGAFRADRGMLIRPDFGNLRINERALTRCRSGAWVTSEVEAAPRWTWRHAGKRRQLLLSAQLKRLPGVRPRASPQRSRTQFTFERPDNIRA